MRVRQEIDREHHAETKPGGKKSSQPDVPATEEDGRCELYLGRRGAAASVPGSGVPDSAAWGHLVMESAAEQAHEVECACDVRVAVGPKRHTVDMPRGTRLGPSTVPEAT